MTSKRLLTMRRAVPDDAEALARIDAESWPAPLAAGAEAWRSRIERFPEGQIVALFDGEPAAVATAQRISSEFFAAGPITYERLTDGGTFRRSHDPNGDIYQLVGVGAGQVVRGFGIGRRLIDRQIDQARTLAGVKRILGLTRPARYHRHAKMPIEEYVDLRHKTGRRSDPVLEFHLGSGASLISIHKDFRPADVESLGYGVLIEYPVKPEADG
jgi:GNAT superfamily N-acetyltransferase